MGSELEAFLGGYYRDGTPELAAQALLQVTDPNEQLVALFARAAQHESTVDAAFAQAASEHPEHAEWIGQVLDLARSGTLPTHENLEINAPEDLDYLWGEFLLTGALGPVRRIADTLSWPDRTREALEAWSQKTPFLPWARKRHEALSSHLRTTGLLDEPGDLDLRLWKLMSGGFQVSQLPFTVDHAFLRPLMIKGAACWSLQSNAQQHPKVAEFAASVDALATAPSFV
ncbi:MAG: hypothetical protein AAGE52_06360 [Myxococcota bacterium]